ncbi:hypothetical protein ACL02T_13125 [Pseudonocardia sp. RS010]|uniref:hypothetical protein n=1 Tax=Pseudonocardia sp. RS010 TaxID=3385979 RepID=UPI0039A0C95F
MNGGPLVRSAARRVLAYPWRPVWARLRPRIEQVVALESRVQDERLRYAIETLRNEVREEFRADDGRLAAELRARVDDLAHQLELLSVHMVALEERLGTLERRQVDLHSTEPERAEARSLVEEVRTEHRRASSKLAAIAFYEERISRLEELTGSTRDRAS